MFEFPDCADEFKVYIPFLKKHLFNSGYINYLGLSSKELLTKEYKNDVILSIINKMRESKTELLLFPPQ